MTDSGNGNGNGLGRGTTVLNGGRPDGRRMAGASQGGSSNLGDLLERVLDKGIIIAGDITLCLGEIELLQIKIRLLIASVDRARDMGIDWWQHDPALSSAAHKAVEGRDQLAQRLERLETMLASLVQDREQQQRQQLQPPLQPPMPQLPPADAGTAQWVAPRVTAGNGSHA